MMNAPYSTQFFIKAARIHNGASIRGNGNGFSRLARHDSRILIPDGWKIGSKTDRAHIKDDPNGYAQAEDP